MELTIDYLHRFGDYGEKVEEVLEKDNQRGEYIGYTTGYTDGIDKFTTRLLEELESKLSEKIIRYCNRNN